jgi:DNA-binding NarL/FixJ family response regulator
MIEATMAANGDTRPSKKRVMIVDDSLQVRSDLCTLLELIDDFEIVGEASNGEEAFIQAVRLKPDVILMDLEMPFMTGYEATRQIKERFPACRVIALSVHGYPEARQRACQARVDAFIVKGEPLANLVYAIRKEM